MLKKRLSMYGFVGLTIFLASYTAANAAGDDALVVIQTTNVTAEPDTVAPVITLIGDNTLEVVQGEAYTELGATTTDNVDPAGSAVASGTVDINKVGNYTITYTAIDTAGNAATATTRTISVIPNINKVVSVIITYLLDDVFIPEPTSTPDLDNTPPVITIIGDNPKSVVQGSAYIELGATTNDNVDADGDASASGTVDTDAVGRYTITYTASDAAGNDAVAVTRTVNVVSAPDTELPVITLTGTNPIELVQGETYTELGATTTDNVDAAGVAIPSGTVDTSAVGSYIITYTASDAAGNDAVAVTRTVNVVAAPDTTAPVITLIGANPTEVVQGETYTELGATTTDNVDGAGVAIPFGTVNTDVVGRYLITYTATDAAGNEALEVTRTVNVVAAEATFPRAYRLLLQTTFGPTLSDLSYVQANGITEWIDEQLAMSSAYDSDTDDHRTHLERVIEIAEHAEPNIDWYAGSGVFNHAEFSSTIEKYQMAAWWENALGLHPTNTLHGSDQLRQRVAYALSQLLVTSNFEPPFDFRGESLAYYYDILTRHAFGNYRDLLGEMARSPTMGVYLSHQGNQKANVTDGTHPDENFARELMQLFTIGLYELNRDGSENRDGDASTYPDAGTKLVPTYTQDDTEELSKVMTGWDLVGNTKYGNSGKAQGDHTQQMEFTPSMHEDEIEEGGDGLVTLLGETFALNAADTDGNSSGMDAALDILFNHPNVGPYISKKLIMRLVTSNPSAGYIDRVATVFNDDGEGVRGNLKAVVRAILVDIEARSDTEAASAYFGKVKEPLLAWSQFLRATDAMTLDGWVGRDGTSLVSDIFWLRTPEQFLGQGPLRSPSVFNFYSDDYVPSDPAFSSTGLVAPELQIQTDQMLLSYNNQINSQIYNFEKNGLIGKNGTDIELAAFAATRRYANSSLILINFDKELALMKAVFGGDFDNIDNIGTDGIALRDKAIDALIVHLDRLLLGESMTAEYKAALQELLVNSNAAKNGDNFTEALNMIQITVRVIVSSNLYTVQK